MYKIKQGFKRNHAQFYLLKKSPAQRRKERLKSLNKSRMKLWGSWDSSDTPV